MQKGVIQKAEFEGAVKLNDLTECICIALTMQEVLDEQFIVGDL